MRIVYALLLLFAVTVAAAGDSITVRTPATAAPAAEQACLDAANRAAAGERMAQAGNCCKGHKGVCGCRAGKIVCCDKTFASGCACNQDQPPLTL